MCGIFVYAGESNNAQTLVAKCLKSLDYRGYDSWGIASIKDHKINLQKFIGVVDQQKLLKIKSTSALGHTRWATHGGVSVINAHPHLSSDGTFALVQNGIVENYLPLKNFLTKKKYSFISQTDTEVIVRLIEYYAQKYSLKTAVVKTAKRIKGRNTFVLITTDGQIIASKNGSPLVVGISPRAVFLSSDALSFANLTKRIAVVEDGQIICIKKGQVFPHNLQFFTHNIQINTSRKKFKHYMLSEIHNTPKVIKAVIKQDLHDLIKAIKKSRQVYCLGSGTAAIAASQIAFYLRSIAGVNAIPLIAAESNDYYPLINNQDLVIVPSQSGETADVLEALKEMKKRGIQIASYVNMPGSTLTRISDFPFMANAGGEISVMSTKIFTSQICFGYLLAQAVDNHIPEAITYLEKTSQQIELLLKDHPTQTKLKKLAGKLIKKRSIYIIGKGSNNNIARETMVKIIEGSYIHAHSLPSGDLKHYAITLMEKGVIVLALTSPDQYMNDIHNAKSQIEARGGEVIEINHQSEIINTVFIQLLAYYMAVALHHNVDKPRHIAKSVTVK